MTLTKEQAGKLIDKLADKAMTFGCEFKRITDGEIFWLPEWHNEFSKRVYSFVQKSFPIDILTLKTPHQPEFDNSGNIVKIEEIYVNIGHPIMIGDVLEKMEKAKFTTKDLERIFPKALSDSQKKKGVTLHHDNLYIEINHLWRNCGFTKSLQEIFEMIEWECKCALRHVDHDEKCFPWIAKPSPATELFQFLASLFTP